MPDDPAVLSVDAGCTNPLDRGHTATMKVLCFLFVAAIASAVAPATLGAAEPPRGPAIEFCDEELSLAHVETLPDGSVFNVYLRPDETPDNWHLMVALRHHPDATVAGIVQRWRAHIAQLPDAGAVLREYQNNTPQDQRFTLALHDESDTSMELEAVRFVPDATGKGVCFLEAAVRVKDEKSPRAVEEALERQQEFAEALPKLTLEPVSTPVDGSPTTAGAASAPANDQPEAAASAAPDRP